VTAAQTANTRTAPPAAPQTVSRRRRARTASVSSRSLQRAGVAAAGTLALLLTAYIGEYASVAKASRERAALRRELHRAMQENSNLHAQVQILERPQRIDDVARKMGMEQRSDADYIALAPLPAEPAQESNKPILAGFLPERWANLFGEKE